MFRVSVLMLLVFCDLRTHAVPMGSQADSEVSSPAADTVPCGQRNIPSVADAPTFSFHNGSDGVVISVTVPSELLDVLPFVELEAEDGSMMGYCVPLSPAAAGASGGDGTALVVRSTVPERLPLDRYTARLACCDGASYQSHPAAVQSPLVGEDHTEWSRRAWLSPVRTGDTETGPAMSLSVVQQSPRFASLRVSHNGCADDPKRLLEPRAVPADRPYPLHADCRLAYNQPFFIRVEPDTRYCRLSLNCVGKEQLVKASQLGLPPPPAPPLTVRSAGPSALLTVGLPLLALLALLMAGAGLLYIRCRKHHRALPALTAPPAQHENGGYSHELTGPRVLLLHLARSDAERAALRQLTDELRQRGATVVDSAAPEWRRKMRSDTAALASDVSCADRVLLLSSPAVAAAVAAGGGRGERERLLAAAAQQLAAGRLASDYGRLYQARLTADAPTLAAVVPGAAYTLPEHQRELVAALLAGTGAKNGVSAAPSDHTAAAIATTTEPVTGAADAQR